eukprot:jgi/Galph1/180/GphlegSOOS_G4979.1
MVRAKDVLDAQCCDYCHVERATAYCELDHAFLCDSCDAFFHEDKPQTRKHVRICLTAGVLEAYSGPRKPPERRNRQGNCMNLEFFPSAGNIPSFQYKDSPKSQDSLDSMDKHSANGRWWLDTLDALDEITEPDSLVPEVAGEGDEFCHMFLRDETLSPLSDGSFSTRISYLSTNSSLNQVPFDKSRNTSDVTSISDISENTTGSRSVETGQLVENEKTKQNNFDSSEMKYSRRRAALERFRQKKVNRCFQKKIRYECRKKLADVRPRIKGRFVKKEELEILSTDTDATVPSM